MDPIWISMNYHIEKHEMNIILDALQLLHQTIRHKEDFGLVNDLSYNLEDVDTIFQSFDNSYVENYK